MDDRTENEERLKELVDDEVAQAEDSLQRAADHLRALRIAMPGDRGVRCALVRMASLHLEVLSFHGAFAAMRRTTEDVEGHERGAINRLG